MFYWRSGTQKITIKTKRLSIDAFLSLTVSNEFADSSTKLQIHIKDNVFWQLGFSICHTHTLVL